MTTPKCGHMSCTMRNLAECTLYSKKDEIEALQQKQAFKASQVVITRKHGGSGKKVTTVYNSPLALDKTKPIVITQA